MNLKSLFGKKEKKEGLAWKIARGKVGKRATHATEKGSVLRIHSFDKPEVHDWHSGYVQENIKKMKKHQKKHGYTYKEYK